MTRLRRVRLLLGAVLLGLVIHLVFGDKPWSGGIAERLAEGLPVRPIDYARTYRWWIALGNALLVAGLLASARAWLGTGAAATPDAGPVCPAVDPRARRAVAAVAALAIAVCAALAAPRLGLSFWDDERYTVARSMDGHYAYDRRGELVFREVAWRDSFLYTKSWPNNHVPFTLLGRISLSAWRLLARPDTHFASEVAVRLPAFLAGLAAVGAAAWSLTRLGMPLAGGFAALFLALHPWHVRYASEARGYSLVLLCLPLLVGLLPALLERGTWRRWLAFAGVETVLLWVYPGAVAVPVVANAALALALWHRHRGTPGLRQQGARFLVANLVAGGVWCQLMLPNVLMFLWHMDWTRDVIGPSFLRNLGSHLLVGNYWIHRHAPEHYVSLLTLKANAPHLYPVLKAATIAAAALGALRLLGRGAAGIAVAALLVLPAPLTLWMIQLRETDIHEWYLIFALPSLVLLVGAGLAAPFAWLRRPGPRVAAGAALMATYLAAYVAFSADMLARLRSSPIQPARDAVLRTRPTLDPFDPRNQRIITVSWARVPLYYDPRLRMVSEVSELEALLREADATGKELFVNYGRVSTALSQFDALVTMADRTDLFEPVAELYGYEPRGWWRVYRYRGRDTPSAPAEGGEPGAPAAEPGAASGRPAAGRE